jgi:hypothetical protein
LSAGYGHSGKIDGDTLVHFDGVQFKDDAVSILQAGNCCGTGE